MKNSSLHSMLTALLMITALTGLLLTTSGCDKTSSPTGSSDSTATGGNITSANFPTAPTGGDIRGTYTPNTPFMKTIFNFPGVTFTENPGTNTGSGTLQFSGSTATSGTYTTTDFVMNVDYTVTLTTQGGSQQIQIKVDDAPGTTTGTWQVIDASRIYIHENGPSGGGPDTVYFAVNSYGVFLFNTEIQQGGSSTSIMAFKKK